MHAGNAVVCTANQTVPRRYLYRGPHSRSIIADNRHLLITAIEIVAGWLHRTGDPKLWEWVPVLYLFDTMDLAILIAFIWYGTAEAIRAFRE